MTALALTLALAGCDGGDGLGDGGTVRDASLRDADGLLDAGFVEAGPLPRDGGAGADAGALLCELGICDPRTGSGCSTGEQCVLVGAEPSCVTTPGLLEPGVECVDNAECEPGSACFEVDGVGRCAAVCCPGDDSECDGDSRCGGSGTLFDGTPTDWGQCVPRVECDVLEPSAECASREGCYIVDAEGATECRLAGVVDAGGTCYSQEECASGFFCGGLPPARTCRRICDLELDDCPPSEGSCVQQGHSPEGSGICTLDMAARAAMNR